MRTIMPSSTGCAASHHLGALGHACCSLCTALRSRAQVPLSPGCTSVLGSEEREAPMRAESNRQLRFELPAQKSSPWPPHWTPPKPLGVRLGRAWAELGPVSSKGRSPRAAFWLGGLHRGATGSEEKNRGQRWYNGLPFEAGFLPPLVPSQTDI